MSTQLFAVLALLSLGSAQLSNSVDIVATGASTLSSKIANFDPVNDGGMAGALAINIDQYSSFSVQIFKLEEALSSLTPATLDTELATMAATLETNLSNLLGALSSKASAFDSVYTKETFAEDVTELYKPTQKIVSAIVSAANGRCDILSIIAPGISSLDLSFSAAAKTYSVAATSFTIPATCSSSTTQPTSTTAPSSSTSSLPTIESSSTSAQPTATDSSSSAKPTSTTESSPTIKPSSNPTSESTPTRSTQKCLIRATGTEEPITSFYILA